MSKIKEFVLPYSGYIWFDVPFGAKAVSVGLADSMIMLSQRSGITDIGLRVFVLTNEDLSGGYVKKMVFLVVGNDEKVDDENFDFVGTTMSGGIFRHVFTNIRDMDVSKLTSIGKN